MKKLLIIGTILFICCSINVYETEAQTELLISGKTMGTTYHIKIVADSDQIIPDIQKAIDGRLEAINRSMSTYREDSEISRFNDLRDDQREFEVSPDFLKVMTVSEKLYDLTGGAWDGTVNPLVNLWGFGHMKRKEGLPGATEIEAMKARVGFHRIEISPKGYLKKKNESVTVDLASIAKGYGVDCIARVLRDHRIDSFLIEIGGEGYASGVKSNGEAWKIGINLPEKAAGLHDVYRIMALQNKAFATSGDYRNFFEIDGKLYSHVIDPKTGYPVSNGVVSATVIADDCTFADGLATALMVMGHENGIRLVDKLDRVECMIVVRNPYGKLFDHYSRDFHQYVFNSQ